MFTRSVLAAVVVAGLTANAAQAAPVAEPNGRVTGTFGDTALDLPVLCEKAPFLVIRSHDGADTPGVEIALPGAMASVEIRTGAGTRQFGTGVDDLAFPLTLAGDVDGTDFDLEITCPAALAG